MAEFDGVIEELTQACISGWVALRGRPGERPGIFAKFTNGRVLAPSHFPEREGATGFRFDLPLEFAQLSLQAFVDLFDGVYAIDRANPAAAYPVPLFKSVMIDAERANRTAVVAARFRDYALAPRPGGSMAVFTIAYNDFLVLPLWVRYYADVAGLEHLFIIDHGSSRRYDGMLPQGVNICRIPRETIDMWQTARIAGMYQRYLLESYDAVIYAGPEEFICADPAALGGQDLRSFLLELPDPIGIGQGYGLVQHLGEEPAYDPTRPVLEQRRCLVRDPSKDKPLVTRVPLSWAPGLQSAVEGGEAVSGLYTLNLGLFDLGHALAAGKHYRNGTWHPLDVAEELASFQRESDEGIVATFRRLNELFPGLTQGAFDASAEAALAPDWMRAAIRI